MFLYAKTSEDPAFEWAKTHLHAEDGVQGVGQLLAYQPSFKRRVEQELAEEGKVVEGFQWPKVAEGLEALTRLIKPLDKSYKPVAEELVEAMLGPGYKDFKAASWRCQSDEKKAAEDFEKLPQRIQRMWRAKAEDEDLEKLDSEKRFDQKCKASLTELAVQFYEYHKALEAAKGTLEQTSYKAKRSHFTESRSKFVEKPKQNPKTSKQNPKLQNPKQNPKSKQILNS